MKSIDLINNCLDITALVVSGIMVNKENFSVSDTIEVSVNVKNNSEIDGYETIQLYSSDLYASITPDIKRLRDFNKVIIKAGETKRLVFSLPVSELEFYNIDNVPVIEQGRSKISINDLNQEIFIK